MRKLFASVRWKWDTWVKFTRWSGAPFRGRCRRRIPFGPCHRWRWWPTLPRGTGCESWSREKVKSSRWFSVTVAEFASAWRSGACRCRSSTSAKKVSKRSMRLSVDYVITKECGSPSSNGHFILPVRHWSLPESCARVLTSRRLTYPTPSPTILCAIRIWRIALPIARLKRPSNGNLCSTTSTSVIKSALGTPSITLKAIRHIQGNPMTLFQHLRPSGSHHQHHGAPALIWVTIGHFQGGFRAVSEHNEHVVAQVATFIGRCGCGVSRRRVSLGQRMRCRSTVLIF